MVEYNLKDMRKFFLDLDATLGLVEPLVERACENTYGTPTDEIGKRGKEIYAFFCEEQIKGNFETIHRYAKSPIEKLFLSTLHMSAAMYDPLHVIFTPPLEADTFPDYLREQYKASKEMWERYKELMEDADPFAFIEQIEEIYNDKMERENLDVLKSDLTRYIILYDTFDMYNKYHLSLQTSFKDIRVHGSRVRPDLFIWIPSKPDFKLIVECDGYTTHSSKEVFSKDRAKDRMFQSKGYQVFRFSGQDIYRDPAGQSMELFDYLIALEKKLTETEEN